MFNINEIGIVRSRFKQPADPFEMKKEESVIEINNEFIDGLYRVEECEFIDVVFCFHLSKDYELKTTNYFGEFKGVFATRSPRRPTNIGVTTVKLLRHDENRLYVSGLDAIDGTPVLDIKPHSKSTVSNEESNNLLSELKDNPRKQLIPLIKNNSFEELLILSGTLHGHYCPGLSMGVMAATYAVNRLGGSSDGMEDLLSVIEINSCFADAIQYITGCSIGNNSLIYRDFGKAAFSYVNRDGTGVRLSSKPTYREKQRERFPEFSKYFNMVVVEKNRDKEVLANFKKLAREASFKMLETDINDIFKIEDVRLDLPDYAPIRETIFCSKCGEGIMKMKEVNIDGKIYCKSCYKSDYFQLDGAGITCYGNYETCDSI